MFVYHVNFFWETSRLFKINEAEAVELYTYLKI